MPTESSMKFQPSPDELVQLFGRIMKALPGAETRKMFGYPAAFVNGQMFSGLHDESMIIRLSSDDLKRFFQLPDVRPFEPMPGRPMKEYALVPAALLASENDLISWLEKSFDYVKGLPAKPPKKKKKS